MQKDPRKDSDALILAAMLDRCSAEAIGSSPAMIGALNEITERYRFTPGDPHEDKEFSSLVDMHSKMLKAGDHATIEKARFLFRRWFRAVI